MSSRFRGSDLAANIKAAVIAWVVAMGCSLLLAALLLALSALASGSDSLATVLIFGAFVASLAVLFLAGFVCSRFAASRLAVWTLIVLLLLPGLLRNQWGSPWVSVGGGAGLSLDGLGVVTRLIGETIGAIFTWLVGILPVLAGAGYEEKRRFASR